MVTILTLSPPSSMFQSNLNPSSPLKMFPSSSKAYKIICLILIDFQYGNMKMLIVIQVELTQMGKDLNTYDLSKLDLASEHLASNYIRGELK